MGDFLQKMADASSDRVSMLRSSWTSEELDRPVCKLKLNGFDLIAEVKERSPAEGDLSGQRIDRSARAVAYAEGGAAAISVLTEPFRFAGEIAHLDEVVNAVAALDVPVMRKDFLVHTSQVLEARASGASGVLLIAAILDDAALEDMLSCAGEHGLFVLLESFSEDDLARCCRLLDQTAHAERAAAGELLLGVNTRNLRTLAVDPTRLERLADRLPPTAVAVAESGVVEPDDAARIASQGYAMALVGTALMLSKDPRQLVADMLSAGRGSRAV